MSYSHCHRSLSLQFFERNEPFSASLSDQSTRLGSDQGRGCARSLISIEIIEAVPFVRAFKNSKGNGIFEEVL